MTERSFQFHYLDALRTPAIRSILDFKTHLDTYENLMSNTRPRFQNHPLKNWPRLKESVSRLNPMNTKNWSMPRGRNYLWCPERLSWAC